MSRLQSLSRFIPVIRPTFLHRFLDGARTVSPVARHALVTVLSLTTPPECHNVSVSPRHAMLPSPRHRGLGLRSHVLFRGHHWVHVCYGPVTRSPSLGLL